MSHTLLPQRCLFMTIFSSIYCILLFSDPFPPPFIHKSPSRICLANLSRPHQYVSFKPAARTSLIVTQHAGASLSLLSLSIAAANAKPMEVPQDPTSDPDDCHSWRAASVEPAHHLRNASQGLAVHNGMKHRRLSSTGQVRRRLSDARDAASRPS